MATEGFQRLVDASEEEQRELRMLRAAGMLPPGIAVTPRPSTGTPSAAPSASNLGHRRLRGSPPFLAGLVSQLRKLPLFGKSSKGSKGASEGWRRRRNTDARTTVALHSRDAVSQGFIRAGGNGGRKDGGATIGADLAVASRPQSEGDVHVRVLEAGHVTQGDVGETECTGGVERGQRDETSSRFEVYHSSCRYGGPRSEGARGNNKPPAPRACSDEATVEEGIG